MFITEHFVHCETIYGEHQAISKWNLNWWILVMYLNLCLFTVSAVVLYVDVFSDADQHNHLGI